jgi:integrase/recombinase XerD
MVQKGSWEWLIQGFRIDLETQVKPRTVKDYCEHVYYFVRWAQGNDKRDPRSITKRDIQEFLHFVASTPAIVVAGNGAKRHIQRDQNSRWHHYFPLKRFFSWATNERYLAQNPMDSIVLRLPKPAPIEPYQAEHIDAFVKVLDHDWQVASTARQKMLAARNRAVLFLLLDSFIRLEELSQLSIRDIDLDRQRVLVRKSKTGKPRLAGFGPQTKKALWRYLGLCGNGLEHEALWITEEGRLLTKHGIQEIMRRLKKDAGLEHLRGSIHRLRHTGATITLKHTRDMKGLKLLLGHSTLAMTERYTQFIEAEDALKAYNGEGPLDWLRG